MGVFENCCCFFDLRVGAALSGVYSAVSINESSMISKRELCIYD